MSKGDRKLDALVAEKVMGWRWARSDYAPLGHDGPSGALLAPWRWLVSPEGMKLRGVTPATGDETPYINNVPGFSTNIAVAWEVVEKLSPSNPFELVDVGSFNPQDAELPKDRRWEARFAESPQSDGMHTGLGATAPLAICLAALMAMGFGAEVPAVSEPDPRGVA